MLDIVKELIRVSPNDSYTYGCDAKFMKIDNQWGFKFFHDKNIRNITYKLQKKAYTIQCAPAIGKAFSITTPNNDKVYGYITECVVKLGNDIYKEKLGINGDYCAGIYQMMTIDGYDDLINNLKKIMTVRDMHGSNVGLLHNGKMVAIDFSFCSKY